MMLSLLQRLLPIWRHLKISDQCYVYNPVMKSIMILCYNICKHLIQNAQNPYFERW